MRIVYVNLARRTDRREFMETQLAREIQTLPVSRFEAIEPSFETLFGLVKDGKLSKLDYIRILSEETSFVTRGSVGCFLSHLELFRACRDAQEIYILLEDDVTLFPGFEKRLLKGLDTLGNEFDVVYLGQPSNQWQSHASPHGELFWKLGGGYSGTFGYVIHPQYASFLLDIIFAISNHIDNTMLNIHAARSSTRVFLFREWLLTTDVQPNRNSDVTLPRRLRRFKVLLIPQRFFYETRATPTEIQSWRFHHPVGEFIECNSKQEALDKIASQGGFFIGHGLYCNYPIVNLLQHCNVVWIEGNSDKFFGCVPDTFSLVGTSTYRSELSDSTLILPEWIINAQKNPGAILFYV